MAEGRARARVTRACPSPISTGTGSTVPASGPSKAPTILRGVVGQDRCLLGVGRGSGRHRQARRRGGGARGVTEPSIRHRPARMGRRTAEGGLVKLWKVLGLAGMAGVAATGVVVARGERHRRSYGPDDVRARLHQRHDDAQKAQTAPPAAPEVPDRSRRRGWLGRSWTAGRSRLRRAR